MIDKRADSMPHLLLPKCSMIRIKIKAAFTQLHITRHEIVVGWHTSNNISWALKWPSLVCTYYAALLTRSVWTHLRDLHQIVWRVTSMKDRIDAINLFYSFLRGERFFKCAIIVVHVIKLQQSTLVCLVSRKQIPFWGCSG